MRFQRKIKTEFSFPNGPYFGNRVKEPTHEFKSLTYVGGINKKLIN